MNAGGPSVLVVDDEEDTCRNLADIFGDLGYQVDTALDGPSALKLVRLRRYDMALLDLMMPGMDGAALYAEMKKLRASIVALLVTAYPGHPRAEAALAQGVWRLLPKPVCVEQVLGLIEEVAGQPLVLVVDDDPDLCGNLWDLLREQGYRVGVAQDAASAAERVREGGYRVILLDMRLPDGDGAQVLREARRAGSEAEVVVITGHHADLEEKLSRALSEGARAVLDKPLDVPALLALLWQLTAGQGRRG